MGGYAGATRLLASKEDELPRVAIPLSLLAIAMLIGGIYIGEHAYVLLYTLVCPAMIGLGVGRISHTALMQKRSVVTGLIILLAIISIALIMVGAGSGDWIMTIYFYFGTGLRVLCAVCCSDRWTAEITLVLKQKNRRQASLDGVELSDYRPMDFVNVTLLFSGSNDK